MKGTDSDRRLEELFALACEQPPAERPAFAERHCPDDPDLRRELLELLREDDEGTRDFLKSPVLAADDASQDASAPLPKRIGRFRILDKIGEGGMGSIYLAEEQGPLQRKLALKIVKLGMNTRRVVARFEAERDAIARMEHPCIAKVFGGGVTENGRPYFVMEYAPGLPITDWCDRERLGVRERVALFAEVCEAVQHAHQKGVIHRDLKPSNILVTEQGGRPTPKIIDFGIARAIERDEPTDVSTRHGEVVGTSNYMSPEQALGAGDVDTRTDIYSLGVVLYELLAGVLPFDDLAGRPLAEIQRLVTTRTPTPPSVRVEQLGERAALIARRRKVMPVGLSVSLRGDLDWVLVHAIETERADRYATAAALAVDLHNHLGHIPVSVERPSLAYRARRFLRRNRVAMAFAGVTVALMVAGVIGTTWGMLEASRQRDEATDSAQLADAAREAAIAAEEVARDHAERARVAEQLAEQRRLEAEREAAQAQEVTDFLVDTLSLANPELSDVDVTVRALLERSGDRVGDVFAESPDGELLVRRTLGRALHSLGALDPADRHLRRALDLLELRDGASSDELFDTIWRLAEIDRDLDGRDSFALGYRAGLLGADAIARTHPRLGGSLRQLWESAYRGFPDDVLARFAATRQLAAETLPPFDEHWPVIAKIYAFLGDHLQRRLGRHRSGPEVHDVGERVGRQFLEEAVRIGREVHPADHPDVARHLGLLVTLFVERERFDLAVRPAEEVFEIYERSLPASHWLRARASGMYGECLSGLGVEGAEKRLVASHERIVASRGGTGRACLESAARLVRHCERTGDASAARRYRRELAAALAHSRHVPVRWDGKRLAFGPRYADLVAAMDDFDALASEDVLWHGLSRGEANRLTALCERILEERRAGLLSDLSVVVARQSVHWATELGGIAPAVTERLCDEAIAVLTPHRDTLASDLAAAHLELGFLAHGGERFDDAERHFAQALAESREALGPTALDTLECEVVLGSARVAHRPDADVEGELVDTWQRCVRTLGTTHDLSRAALRNLVDLHERTGAAHLAESYLIVHLRRQLDGDAVDDVMATPAWLVVRSDGFTQELYEMALSSAHQHVAENPFARHAHLLVGAGLYRLGRHREALTQLELSERAHQGRQLLDTLFLSLCKLALGDVDGAGAHRDDWDARTSGRRMAMPPLFQRQLDEAWGRWSDVGGREPRAVPQADPPEPPSSSGAQTVLTEP